MNWAYWLPVIWACLLAFAVTAYVVLDGFDLGVGILFAVEPDYEDRSLMVNSIAPVWDGWCWAAADCSQCFHWPTAW